MSEVVKCYKSCHKHLNKISTKKKDAFIGCFIIGASIIFKILLHVLNKNTLKYYLAQRSPPSILYCGIFSQMNLSYLSENGFGLNMRLSYRFINC